MLHANRADKKLRSMHLPLEAIGKMVEECTGNQLLPAATRQYEDERRATEQTCRHSIGLLATSSLATRQLHRSCSVDHDPHPGRAKRVSSFPIQKTANPS